MVKAKSVLQAVCVFCFISLIGTSDVQATTGNPLVDTVCPCNAGWKNHGEYVSCVAQASKNVTPDSARGAIVRQAAASSCGGGDVITASASSDVTASGAAVVLPDRATLLIPAGAVTGGTATVQAVESAVMDSLGPEVTPGFEFLPNLPKFRVQLAQQPTKLVQLAVAIPNLAELLPPTHDLVITMRIDEAESDDEAPHPALRTVAGEVCEEKTAVCLFVLPKWFTDATGAGLFQVQIGLGRAPNTPQPVALHWWDRLFEWFEAATAFAADSKWHLWTLKSPNPGGGEVSPDASNLLHIGGEIALESDVPELASPLGAIPLQITSDFGQRPPDPFNPSASKYHPAVDFRAKDPLFVYPVLSGTVTEAKTGTFQAECPDKKHLSTPLKQVKVLSNNQLEVTYKHLSEIITQSAGALIGKSGNSGACFFHLDVRMQFKDEFNTRAAIDPWPLISNNVKKFVQSTGDPVTPDCQGCRELFPFDFAVYVTEGKFTNPGVFLPFQGLEGNYSNFSSGQTQHVLTSAEGTIDLSKYPKEVTNGKYVVRITLCSDSIGGCRKVRDWKITPGNTNPWVGTWSGSTTSSCGAYSGPVTLTITSGGGNLLNFTSVWNGGSASFSGSYSGNTATSELGSTYALNGNTITVAYPPACQTATVTRQ